MFVACDGGDPSDCAAGGYNENRLPHGPPQLFTPASDATQVAALVEPPTNPSVPGPHSGYRAVQIDFARLNQAHEALAGGRSAELTANLPLPVVLTTTSDTRRGYALSGHVANDPFSAVNIVVNGRSVAGNIRRRGELHTIRSAGAGYYVQTLDSSMLPRCELDPLGELDREAAEVPLPQSPAVANSAQDDDARDDGTEIDLLVVYTPSGRRSAGGHQGIRTLIEMLVKETNEAYRASDVRQQIRLVAATEVDYELGGIRDALNHLRTKGDGHLEEVHEIRDLYAADLVLLWTPSGGGLASIIDDPSAAAAESLGFSVSPSQAFAHELGHNMGLRHQRINDAGNTPYPYSHGYSFRHSRVQYQTIMHTDFNLPRFSNPRQRYPDSSGSPMGVPGATPTSKWDGPADAARSLNKTAIAIANFRPSATGCRYDLPSPDDIIAEGGSFTLPVRTAATCPWKVKALDPGLSIAEDGTGKGKGEVTFTVERNRGRPRELALRIAGEVYSFRQEGERQPVSVCDRSRSVRGVISAALGGRPCAEITAGDLARIGFLSVGGKFSPGDFDGLTGLGSLVLLPGFSMTHLGDAIFAGAGLDNLHSLTIFAPGTSETSGTLRLSQGVFEGLTGLVRLDLVRVFWETGVFDDTPSLRELTFTEYPQPAFPQNAFRGLNNLERLRSFRGGAETVTFQGLSSLRVLYFASGRLTRLPASAFDDLPELTHAFLHENRLTTLHRNQFRGAPKLWWIDLSRNSIHTVSDGAFAGVPLGYLDISESELTYLSADAFDSTWQLYAGLFGQSVG